MNRKKKLWRQSLGQRGLRVYLFERTPGGSIYREVYARGQRVASKRSLKHADKERAQAEGYALLARLRTREDRSIRTTFKGIYAPSRPTCLFRLPAESEGSFDSFSCRRHANLSPDSGLIDIILMPKNHSRKDKLLTKKSKK